jgi:hypothetical protein
MFKRPELSRIISSNTQYILHGFQVNKINPGNYLIDNPVYELDIVPNCDLFFNKEKIGKFVAQVNHRDQDSVFLYFHKLKNIDLSCSVAVFDIDCKTIRCPACKVFFRIGDSPCSCIQKSLFFYLSEVTAYSVSLYDFRYDNEHEFDLRESLFSKFFGGSMHNLKILDPL